MNPLTALKNLSPIGVYLVTVIWLMHRMAAGGDQKVRKVLLVTQEHNFDVYIVFTRGSTSLNIYDQ